MLLYKKELHDFYRLPDTNIFSIVKSRRLNLCLRKGTHYLVYCDCCKLSKEKNVCHKEITKHYNAIFRNFTANQEKNFASSLSLLEIWYRFVLSIGRA